VKTHVVLTGLMGVGKSTTAQVLAARLGWPERDSDRDIEGLFGATGAELAGSTSVDALHTVESAMLLGALASPEPTVISAAAWVVEDPLCVEALARRATVVVLSASVEDTVHRAAQGDHRRTLDTEAFAALAERREPLFEAVADLRLDATGPTEDLALAILGFLEKRNR